MIYIRVDANNIIATGHLFRCISIAEALKELGEDVTFIMADNNGVSLLEGWFPYIILDTDWRDMNSELAILCDILAKEEARKLIIDSYQVTEKYLSELRKHVKTVYIDDVNAFYYDVDELICYANYYRNNKYEERYSQIKLLLGCNYVPLRKDFRSVPDKVIKPDVDELLIMSGGTDSYNFIGNILENIDDISQYKRVNAICGRYNANYDVLYKKYKGTNVNIVRSTDNIIDYMLSADVALSASGVTLYELCACGTPTLSYVMADNQIDNAVQFDKDGIISYMGDIRKSNVINNIIKNLNAYDMKKRQIQSLRMKKYVDKNGALNIAKEVIML